MDWQKMILLEAISIYYARSNFKDAHIHPEILYGLCKLNSHEKNLTAVVLFK